MLHPCLIPPFGKIRKKGERQPSSPFLVCSDTCLDLGCLAGALAQVEQLRTTNLAAANDVNLLDERAVDREHTLNANT